MVEIGARQMDDVPELQVKLDRVQAALDKSVANLAKQRALIAQRLAEGAKIAEFHELLAALEDTQRLHTQHRDRLRRRMDALAGESWWL
jgi:hypothetical protein